jgi:hypothetical protein
VFALLTLSALTWFAGLRPFLKDGLWRLPRSWYEAGFSMALLFAFLAAWILVTGYTPTRYNSHPIARIRGFDYLEWAAAPLTIGLVAYVFEKRNAPTVGRKSSK